MSSICGSKTITVLRFNYYSNIQALVRISSLQVIDGVALTNLSNEEKILLVHPGFGVLLGSLANA